VAIPPLTEIAAGYAAFPAPLLFSSSERMVLRSSKSEIPCSSSLVSLMIFRASSFSSSEKYSAPFLATLNISPISSMTLLPRSFREGFHVGDPAGFPAFGFAGEVSVFAGLAGVFAAGFAGADEPPESQSCRVAPKSSPGFSIVSS